MLSHIVYFTLNDPTDEAIDHMVGECRQYLKEHPGVVFFAAGRRGVEFQRPVNDQDFHIALHVIFDTKDNHDIYQTAEDHLTFIERNKESWAVVRVFDAYVES